MDRFKPTWRSGSVAVQFDPLDFVGKLATLVARPRSKLVRYRECLAYHASLRAYVVKDGWDRPLRTAGRRRASAAFGAPS